MVDPQKSIKKILKDFGVQINDLEYGEYLYSKEIFEFLKSEINYPKGVDYLYRFKDIISDPNNLFIKRHKDAGKVEDGTVILHNGIKIYNKYYDNFIDVLKYNLGVHEPSEERAFQKVLNVLNDKPIMVELGSYWAIYSLWFKKTFEDGEVFCFESDINNIKVGIDNFTLNGLQGNFFEGQIGKGKFSLYNFLQSNNIEKLDVLHSDIQGSELDMLMDMKYFFEQNKVKYLFLSTHSNLLHKSCTQFLKEVGYKILCSCDFDNETYQYDGFILACPKDVNEISEFTIGDRSKSHIITNEDFYNIVKNNQ